MKKKLLCLSAILAMTSTTMVSFANEVTNYIIDDNTIYLSIKYQNYVHEKIISIIIHSVTILPDDDFMF